MNEQIENAAITAQRRYYSDQQINDSRHQEAFDKLRTELMSALLGDPSVKVETPGFDPQQTSAIGIVADQINADDWLLTKMLMVISLCARGLQKEAKGVAELCIDDICNRHAAWHVGDALNQEAHDDYPGWEE